jgi:predicted transcriptional regulator
MGELERERVLRSPVRARLFEVVARQPGITIQSAADAAGVARTTAAYHLHILARDGLIVQRPAHKTVHCYRNDGRYSEEEQLRLQALSGRRTRQVAELVAASGGVQRSELANLLGLSIATVNWHLRPLADRGLVREELRGRRRLLHGTPALAATLAVLAVEPGVALADPLARETAGAP